MSITLVVWTALPYPHASEENISDPDYTAYTAPVVRETFTRQAQILQHFEGHKGSLLPSDNSTR